MKIKFLGGAECVTGSCHLVTVNNHNIMLDCGLYQGGDGKTNENDNFEFNPEDIDIVILSHAHMDHSGRIPLLFKKGFKGKVLCTNGTKDLCSSMLLDCAHILTNEVEWKNRKRARKGLDLLEPLYHIKDAELSLKNFEGYNYDEEITLFSDLKLIFRDAGHLLGSAICEILVNDLEKGVRKLVYSGDIGNINLPILKDPATISQGDFVIMETTYGNKEHKNVQENLDELIQIIKDTFKVGGNVIIPSFSVGRTQEVIYVLNKYIEKGEIPECKVYIDSPLASKTTEVFKSYEDYFDREARELIKDGDNPLEFKGLYFTETAEDSMALNGVNGIIIIAASGMCEGGRVVHHLKHNLWKEECSVVFVGYQAEGTLGRKILNREKEVKILGEEISVKAKIYNLEGLSGHGDKVVLLNWLKGFKYKPSRVFLVHGESDNIKSFNREISSIGYNSVIPRKNEEFNL
ncbi:MBL fold metallo-hydrolase [Clostridium sp.]|uniref:MBL fold metallo-hydrolase n=1 Tax=Clostridium sp. TaxID=1506 RepID=UPI002FC8FF53